METIQPLEAESARSMADIGILLVGHGTRRIAGQLQLKEVFRQFQAEIAPRPAALSFLELATPDIPAGIQALAKRGVRTILSVPVLLFAAGHALEDIPRAVAAGCRKFDLEILGQTQPFESAEEILRLSARRFQQAACQLPCSPGNPAFSHTTRCGTCHGLTCPQTALLMIGRGSNSAEAAVKMRQFSSTRCKLTPVRWLETAFIHGQQPTVESGLEELLARPEPVKVVQPHLLFEGVLSEQLRLQVAKCREQDPASSWHLAAPLGTDEDLAKTLAKLTNATLSATLRSN